ncbi:MAG: enoyl-CoA hydratase/isomerase family protein [Cyclobacteriaceae bacterium]
MTKPISFEISTEGIGVLTFSNPPHNAMTSAMLSETAQIIHDNNDAKDVKVIVIKSNGERAFCAGASFEELMGITTREEGKTFFSGFAQVINAIRKSGKIVIGQVQGKAVGGGVGLAAACDLCFATDHAAVKLSEINIGIGPFVIGPAVTRRIGVTRFSHLALSPMEFKPAKWAFDNGLYTSLFENMDQLSQAVMNKAEELSKVNPEALTKLKKSLWAGCEDWDDLLDQKAKESGELVLSSFSQSALSKFKK